MPQPFPTVYVIGLGTVGSLLAARLARTGRRVVGVERDDATLTAGRERVARMTNALADAGQESPHIDYTVGLPPRHDADLVIEALPDLLAEKVAVLRHADEVCPADTVFVTTTTGLQVTEIAARSGRMTRTAGLHVCNPGEITAGSIVEVVHTPLTDSAIRRDLAELVAGMGMVAASSADHPGFLGASLLLPYLNSAAAMCGQGYATRDDIDTAMMLGCRMPVGPLSHLDMIGIDVVLDSLTAIAARTNDPAFTPAPILSRMVACGLLGRKTGRGFYRYERGGALVEDQRPVSTDPAPRPVHHIGVVGSGTMASGIAEVSARAGYRTTLVARTAVRADEARSAVHGSLRRGLNRGKLGADEVDAAQDRLSVAAEPGALGDCDFVIEAVSEDLDVKRAVFAGLDRTVGPDAVLATTTSSLSVLTVAGATSRPEHVIGTHFFNPAPVMRLVELVPTVVTAGEVTATASAVVSAMGKQAVRCGDRTGFIVNALLFPHLNRAATALQHRFVGLDEVDTIMVDGYGHPMGPFQLLDTIGLDVSLAIQERVHETFAAEGAAAAKYLTDLVACGYLGRKTGRGFRTHAAV